MPTAIATSRAAGRPRRYNSFLRAPFSARTWREVGYLLISAPLGLIGFGYLVAGVVASTVLSVTLIGIPLLGLFVLSARGWGRLYRWLSAVLLRSPVPAPAPFGTRVRPRAGLFGSIGTALGDRTGWRALAFVAVKAPLAAIGLYGPLFFWVQAWFATISFIPWALAHPTNVDAHGVRHHSLVQLGDFYVDSWPRALAFSGVGLIAVFLAPWPVRWFAQLDRWLAATLLSPAGDEARVVQLERSRAVVVADSAATLRRVERDLHDGTQARLVAVAMGLDQARERLAADDTISARALIDRAHATTKDALVELRDVVRGIHPPALDQGLGLALQTLAARSPLPVQLTVDLPHRPGTEIETIGYFCVAELLTNVARHAQARTADVRVSGSADGLTLWVRDDGQGGARIGPGSGLVGLADRVGAVDGRLTLTSPDGGPTEVRIDLPIRVGAT